jgi:hypothetical protein
MNTIICKHCGKEIEITEALLEQVKADVEKSFSARFKKEFEEEREKLTKELTEKQSLELEDLKKQVVEKEAKMKEFRDEQLKLREDKRKLEEEKKDFEIEMQKKVEEKVKESLEREDERHRLKELENEKKLQDAIKANEELRRKLEQGSQQTQGEVLELDFENLLTDTFPTDEIVAVGKGSKGADVRQIVKTQKGTVCGVILWETKRTKAWDNDWTNKLKGDLRTEKANIPIIVSTVFPKDMKSGMGFVDGVWIVSYSLAITLAEIMRQRLVDVARQKYLSENREGKGEALYEYIISHEFVQQVESLLEVHKEMVEQVNRERAAFEKQWKTRLEYSEKMLKSTARMVGSIQGKLGTTNSLQIKGLDMLSLDSGEDEIN